MHVAGLALHSESLEEIFVMYCIHGSVFPLTLSAVNGEEW